MEKKAIILFNLGGPKKPEDVKEFLFNLFNDKAIIALPSFFRKILAWIIAKRRTPYAQAIYHHLGGGSPLLALTQNQAEALEKKMNNGQESYKIFVAMRYFHPLIKEVVEEVKNYGPDSIILLPLYPHFSTTTTGSSLTEWNKYAKALAIPTKTICCYPRALDFITAHVELIRSYYEEASKLHDKILLVFSAHGLPKKIIKKGDPYEWQIHETIKHIIEKLKVTDHILCYQSKVGPMEWLGPSIDEALDKAAQEQKAVVVVPIAFVSEHSETLVELDIMYQEIAQKLTIPGYFRVPALGVHDAYIQELVNLVRCAEKNASGSVISSEGERICPKEFTACPCSTNNL